MKATTVRVWVVLGLLLVLGVLNMSIVDKERLRRDGETVFLPLAPVDPRALIQGDYMALRFQVAQQLRQRLWPSKYEAALAASIADHDATSAAASAPAFDPPAAPPPEGHIGYAALEIDARRIGRLAGAAVEDDVASTPAAPAAATAAAATAPATPHNATTTTTLKLRYRIRGGDIWLGTNAFFFEEGQAQRFEAARFGEFRVDPRSGEALLVGLRGAQLEPL